MVCANQTQNILKLLLCTTSCAHAATGAGRFAQAVIGLEKSRPDMQIAVVSEDVTHHPEGRRFRIELPGRQVGYATKSRYYAQMVGQVVDALSIDVILFNNAWLGSAWLRDTGQTPAVVGSVRDDNAVHAFDNTLRAIPGMLERKRLEQAACRKLNYLLTNTAYLAEALTTHYRIDRAKISVIHPVYQDYASMPQQPDALPGDAPIRVLFAKHDYHRGGLHLLIKALATLRDRQFHLTVAGPDPRVIRRKFGKQLHDLNHVQVQLCGPVYDLDAMGRLMAGHHVYCVPAKREAFGVAAIEALCCGLRVIYHPVGGVPEALSNFAFPVEEWSAASTRQALVQAIGTNEQAFHAMKEQGRDWAARHFSRDRMLEQLSAFLDRVYNLTSNPQSRTA